MGVGGDERRPSEGPAAAGTDAELPRVRFRRGDREPIRESARVVAELPLTIELDRTDAYTLMRTPGHDRELTAGFLFAEGMIDGRDDVTYMEPCRTDPDKMQVLRRTRPADRPRSGRRNLVVSSSCGLCGRAGIDELVGGLRPVDDLTTFPLATLLAIPDRVRAAQELFAHTGGCHAAALFDADGDRIGPFEDLGRHSALDKAIGSVLLAGGSLAGRAAFLSGRTSLEMVVKVVRARLPLTIAVGAPSDAAVEAASRLGVTLCGFARDGEVAVYCHDWRVVP